MKKSLKQLFLELRKTGLNKRESLKMRENLLRFITANPARLPARQVRKQVEQRQLLTEELVGAPSSFLSLIFRRLTTMPALIVALIIALTGGVSASAQNALPGDALYPVKVEINDYVRSAFAFSSEAKANVETDLAKTRLEEAEQLSASGKLDVETSAELQTRFETFAERVHKRVADLQSRGKASVAADVTSDFEASLKAHEAILDRLQTTSTENPRISPRAEVKSLLKSVRARTESVTKDRQDAETSVSISGSVEVSAAAEGKQVAAENKIAEVKAFVEGKKAGVSAEAYARAQAKIVSAEKTLTEGKVKLEAKAYGEAFSLFQQSLRTAQEAKLTLQAENRLRIRTETTTEAKEEERETSTDTEQKEKDEDSDRVQIRLGL